jgi:competence protein ComGC
MPSEKNIFDIAFEHDGTTYKGWVNPSDKVNDSGMPASFHVVLNDISFGYLSHNNDEWTVNEDRPEGLIKQVGKQIEKHYAV